MAKQRPVPPGGRKSANARDRQANPARQQPASAPPGPRRPSSGDPSDPRPIAAPFMQHQLPARQPSPTRLAPPQHNAPPARSTDAERAPLPHQAGDPDHAHQAANPAPASGPDIPATPTAPDGQPATPAPAPARTSGRPMPSPRRMPPAENAAPATTRPETPATPDPRLSLDLTWPPETALRTEQPSLAPRERPSQADPAERSTHSTLAPDRAPAERFTHPTLAPRAQPGRTEPALAERFAQLTVAPVGQPAEPEPNPAEQPALVATGGVTKAPRPLLPGLQLQPLVHVENMATAVAFYEKLGGEINHGDRSGEWVLMQLGTAQIGLVTRPPNALRGESTVELNFTATMRLDRLEQLLREQGVAIVKMTANRDFGTQLHVETPEGMPIKIHHVEPELLV